MMRTGEDAFLQCLPSFRDGFHPCLLETRNFPVKGVGLAQREEFGEERRGTLVPRADGFFVLIKPLFRLPPEGERKQAEPDGVSRNAPYGYGLA